MYGLNVVLPETGQSKRVWLQMKPGQAMLIGIVTEHF